MLVFSSLCFFVSTFGWSFFWVASVKAICGHECQKTRCINNKMADKRAKVLCSCHRSGRAGQRRQVRSRPDNGIVSGRRRRRRQEDRRSAGSIPRYRTGRITHNNRAMANEDAMASFCSCIVSETANCCRLCTQEAGMSQTFSSSPSSHDKEQVSNTN